MAHRTTVRDPKSDHLLTPENSVFVFIDYQPEQFRAVTSKTIDELMLNLVTLGKAAREFSVPTVLTSVGVELGVNSATIPELKSLFPDLEEIDRTTLNSWEDASFRQAVERTGRRKIVMAGLWTEICVAFPTLDALKDGYDVYPVIDAIGGVTLETHEVAVERMIQAGAQPVTALALACELQRDWARGEGTSLRKIVQGYFTERVTESRHN
ncbi:MAG: hydrolase [Bdellovibrionota bacterium]